MADIVRPRFRGQIPQEILNRRSSRSQAVKKEIIQVREGSQATIFTLIQHQYDTNYISAEVYEKLYFLCENTGLAGKVIPEGLIEKNNFYSFENVNKCHGFIDEMVKTKTFQSLPTSFREWIDLFHNQEEFEDLIDNQYLWMSAYILYALFLR